MALTVTQRNTTTINILVRVGTTLVPIDITGYKLFFVIKREFSDSDEEALVFKTVTSHFDPANGRTNVTLTESDLDFDSGTYKFSATFRKSDNGVLTILTGTVIVKPCGIETIPA